jgi:hypothetical protein
MVNDQLEGKNTGDFMVMKVLKHSELVQSQDSGQQFCLSATEF